MGIDDFLIQLVKYWTTNGSGDFNCDGNDDQVEINKALAYVAENRQLTTVYLRGPNTYVISDSIFIGNNTVLEGNSTHVIKLQYFTNWLNSQQDFISLFHFYRNWVLNFDFLFHNVSSRLELAG